MFDPTHAEFWVLLAFIAFIGLMLYYKVPSLISSSLDDRATQIRTELDDARRLREEARALLVEYQKKTRNAEQEAKHIIEQAQKDAEAYAAETRANLRDNLERRTKLAEEKIARAEAQALSEVRAAAIDAAINAAETILSKKVSGAAAQSLVDESIRDLKRKLN